MPVATKVEKRIEVPEGVELRLEDVLVIARGKNGEISKRLSYPGVRIQMEGREVVIEADYPRKRQAAMVGTFASHIKNMMEGLTEGFMYKMKVVYAHFPMSVTVAGKELLVENYLGEKIPRRTRIVGNCTVAIKGTEIEVHGNNIEEVGQTAGNIEQLTRVKKRDPRVFQDGIYLTERNGIRV